MRAPKTTAEKSKANLSPDTESATATAVQCKGYEARTSFPLPPVQRTENNTGLPDDLKNGVEQLSGLSLDDVQVNYNSAKPASVNALAYAQGTDIHIGPGQEKHLPHEAWHVVQQKQGRVKATRQLKGKVPINDNPALEHEADQMGKKALQVKAAAPGPRQLKSAAAAGPVVQRAIGFEFETGYKIEKKEGNGWTSLKKMDVVKEYPNNIKLTADEHSGGYTAIEMVLDPPVQETEPEKFSKALATFVKIGQAFHALKPADDEHPAPIRFDRIKGVSGSSKYQITPAYSGFLGNPQLTGGIAFEKLYKFIDEATKSGSGKVDNTDPHKDAKAGLTRFKGAASDREPIDGAKIEVEKINGSEQLKGLVAMLGMYLRTGAAGKGKDMFNYAKLISNSFMARTDYGAMFTKLPANEYHRFTHDPQSFVTLVLDAANLKGTKDVRVFERGIRKSDIKTTKEYKEDLTNKIDGLKITREQWLLGITLGHDQISSDAMEGLKEHLMGLGALGYRTDRVANDPAPTKGSINKGKGIIVELRNMALDMRPKDFAALAQQIFDYVVAMNAGNA